jgi:hypothetical protein
LTVPPARKAMAMIKTAKGDAMIDMMVIDPGCVRG